MKLYISPGACSLSPHIVASEAGISLELIKVNLETHQTEDGGDFYAVNVKGAVPTLELDDGQCLTEGAVIAQFLAELTPGSTLLPATGTPARYRVLEWQNYITSEMHKSYAPLFNPAVNADAQDVFRQALAKKYAWIDSKLAGQDYLTGDTFTVADAYLFVVTNWASGVGVKLDGLGNIESFMKRVSARPAVQAAMRNEGLN